MEDAYIIKGGKPLSGSVILSGAKNVALKVIVSSLMLENETIIHNVPRINDVHELIHLINLLGAKVDFIDKNTVKVVPSSLSSNKVDLLHASKIRVSFMFLAPLLLKFGECYIPNPGGCRIGARPIDRVVDGVQQLGISMEYDSNTGYYHAKLIKRPTGRYRFSKSSHTGTELLMLLSTLTENEVKIENAALEPEIDDLISFLNKCGAKIRRVNKTIIINKSMLLKQKEPFTITSDRNEAVTYATLALSTGGTVVISKIPYELINTFVEKVRQCGGGFQRVTEDTFRFFSQNGIKPSNVETAPHPGFMTDWQPNWAILMTQASGDSIISERVFENRFSYVEELRKLGAEIDFIKSPVINPQDYFFFNFDPAKKYNQTIKIKGNQQLHGGVLNIADLRAGATLAIAALIAKGESYIYGASILERGYENFVEKVSRLGGEIIKI
ncbi:MAG: UDP-N-acetylglucosamine 1-carboxyvinyltransferase [Candidatus Roizmanbacteria bacterium GW2011_GWA2_36_23]|uniref:UDP-N-acetylglucosamine 1-carboxyvinyltransferase n=1 Tax=Candidatus Roizmanbacteria bacterium GW2011_GWA2_36_23 TaxID=1618480 RepID=A0A0G0E8S8_9BACT|nr:MAG: UDP-N-acetylglucosamine 1-carboxyvinyltransferase [Candidatus Roizmanbacteria bacterium GW2011_GWA2_36_23]